MLGKEQAYGCISIKTARLEGLMALTCQAEVQRWALILTNSGHLFCTRGGVGWSWVCLSQGGLGRGRAASWAVHSSLDLESVYFKRRMSALPHWSHWLILSLGCLRRALSGSR